MAVKIIKYRLTEKGLRRQKELVWLIKLILATIAIMLIGGYLIERFGS